MKLFLLGVFGAFTLLVLFFNFGTDFKNGGASAAATTAQPLSGPLPTVDPRAGRIFYNLNMSIEDMERSTKFTMLEHINGASYQVVHVGFLPENGVPTKLQVNTRCECAGNAQCCSPLHTLVITMQAMDDDLYQENIVGDVPGTVTDIEVQCFDHTNLTGGMTAPWQDVVTFLRSDLQGHGMDGFRLWYEVTPAP